MLNHGQRCGGGPTRGGARPASGWWCVPPTRIPRESARARPSMRGEEPRLQWNWLLPTRSTASRLPRSSFWGRLGTRRCQGECPGRGLRKAQRQHPDRCPDEYGVGRDPRRRAGDAGGRHPASTVRRLACRPDSFAIHFILGHALEEQREAAPGGCMRFCCATQLSTDSAWASLAPGGALVHLNKLPERGEVPSKLQLKPLLRPPTRPWYAYPLRQSQRLVELDDKFGGCIARGIPALRCRRACRDRRCSPVSRAGGCQRPVVRGEAFVVEPDLANQHRYDAAWAVVPAGTGKGKDAVALDERNKARLRGQARGLASRRTGRTSASGARKGAGRGPRRSPPTDQIFFQGPRPRRLPLDVGAPWPATRGDKRGDWSSCGVTFANR